MKKNLDKNTEDSCAYGIDVFVNGVEKKGIQLQNGDIQVDKDVYDKEDVFKYSYDNNDRVNVYGSPKRDEDEFKGGW